MKEAYYLVDNFKVEKVVFNGGEYNELELELISLLKEKNISYEKAPDVLKMGEYKLQFLNTGIYDNENDNSNVIYLEFNKYKFLFMGEAGVDVEKAVFEKYYLSDIDFLKVGHHGSDTSSCKEFIDNISSKYSIISVGGKTIDMDIQKTQLWIFYLILKYIGLIEMGAFGFCLIRKDMILGHLARDGGSMNYYNKIKEKLLKNEIYEKVKDYSKEKHRVVTYFEIGRLLNEAGKEYGKNIIKQYSEKLMVEVGKKYKVSNLYKMRKFYEIFSDEKLYPLGTKLSWSHYRELLTIKNIDAIMYYIDICEENNLSKRQLQERIRNHEYDRLSNETKTKLIESKELKVDDLIPNPIVIKSNMLKDNLSEYALKQAILNNIDDFLRQLGIGFTYVGNEYKIKLGSKYNYIDLLLYNIKYKCYVVVELKVTELKKEHTGQIMTYMNYIDENVKGLDDNKTVTF